MIYKERSVTSRIKRLSFLEEIITFSIEVFKDCESEMAVVRRLIGNTTRVTAESKVIVQQIAGS